MSGPRRRLRNRLMLAFAGFTLLVAALFGFYVAIFAYAVEDQFFSATLEQEAAVQQQHHARTGQWTKPREPYIVVVESADALPDGIAVILRDEPQRTEFPGREGRHYHLRPLASGDGSARGWLVAEVSERLVVRPRRVELMHLLAWSGAIVVALALLLGWWLARRATAPLARLASLVDDMQPGRLPARLADGFPDDEVGVLARGLDALTGRIGDFVTREREFTRDASHELRTPLAVIRSAGERLATEPGLSSAGRQQLEHMRQSALHLEQTVATLLALAREDAAHHGITGPVALLPLIERVIVEQSPLLGERPVEVHTDVPATATSSIPAPVLRILLSNLIGNAFAHTARGRVSLRVDGTRLLIGNRDDAGPSEIDGGAWLPFAKRENSAGFGLGLSIVHRVCAHHDIDLRIDSHGNETIASLALSPSDHD